MLESLHVRRADNGYSVDLYRLSTNPDGTPSGDASFPGQGTQMVFTSKEDLIAFITEALS